MAQVRKCDVCGAEVKLNVQVEDNREVITCYSDHRFAFKISMYRWHKGSTMVPGDLCRKCLIQQMSEAILNLPQTGRRESDQGG